MIFIVRSMNAQLSWEEIRLVRIRMTPAPPGAPGERDLFCVGDADVPDRLRAQGCTVISLHDGWYADDHGGGVAVWGNGRYWEVRDSPFDVVDQG